MDPAADSIDPATIGDELVGLDPPIELILHPGAGAGNLGDLLSELAGVLVSASNGGVVVRPSGEADDALPAVPGLSIARAEHGGVRYLALPEGPETAPFVELLHSLAGMRDPEPPGPLERIERPAELLVFVAAACSHCPHAVRTATRLALANPCVTATVIEAQRFPDLAARYGVQSVPATVLDGELTWVGVEGPAQVTERILRRGTETHARDVFASLVESGRLADAARRIVAGDGAAHFAAIWLGSTTSARIGLMLVAETALEQDPQALHGAVRSLLPALASDDAALRGDTADLIGQTGHPEGLAALRPLLDDPNPDVAEIAAEALGLDESSS